MPARRDPVRVGLQLLVYVVLYVAVAWVCGSLLRWLDIFLVSVTVTGLAASAGANLLSLRIFEGLHLEDAGLAWNRAALRNLAFGALGGAGSATLVLSGPLALRVAHFVPAPEGGASL